MNIEDTCKEIRDALKVVAKEVRGLMNHEVFDSPLDSVRNEPEMKANIMLTYRHIEDATMRLGKVIQAHDGGKSVYDK